ncbi:Uncharacterized protein Rs2_06344 [Raphanus sativus]|nr:Uncharacterized protein Rs2_06344 [Raphanus sativus]
MIEPPPEKTSIIAEAAPHRSTAYVAFCEWVRSSTTNQLDDTEGFTNEGKDDDGSRRRLRCRHNTHQPSRQFSFDAILTVSGIQLEKINNSEDFVLYATFIKE